MGHDDDYTERARLEDELHEERRRYKKAGALRKRKQRRRNLRNLLILVVLAALVLLLLIKLGRGEPGTDASLSDYAESSRAESADSQISSPSSEDGESSLSGSTGSSSQGDSSASPESAVTAWESDEWALILVNRDNPMPENYTVGLDAVNSTYKMEKRAAAQMRKMIEAARKDSIELTLISAYRSLEYQRMLFENNIVKLMDYGMTREEAEIETARNIAIPGTSEHTLGLAADIATPDWYTTHSEISPEFENTPQSAWLMKNADKYGFILRYPKDKEHITKITYEPWHYRYVGVKNAAAIKKSGLCLEEYLEQHPVN